MEHWPADERHKSLPVKKQARGKGNKKLQVYDAQYWNHPSLDYGTFGGATLMSSDGRLAWTTVVDTSNSKFELCARVSMILVDNSFSSKSDTSRGRVLHFSCHSTCESDTQSSCAVEAN
jgi:hypothetical protein